jgi:hypothetical protein
VHVGGEQAAISVRCKQVLEHAERRKAYKGTLLIEHVPLAVKPHESVHGTEAETRRETEIVAIDIDMAAYDKLPDS